MWNVLLAPLRWIWERLKGLAALAFPMFAASRPARGLGPVARRVLHLMILAAILASAPSRSRNCSGGFSMSATRSNTLTAEGSCIVT